MNYTEASMLLKEHGQEHLLQYYDELTAQQQAALLKQIDGINFSDYKVLGAAGAR